jgi:hypothetical protein
MAQSEATDTDTTPAAPPNLRAAASEDRECGNCTYYDHTHCTKFPPLCVSDEWLCDAWKPSGRDVVPENPKTVRAAGKTALARAREARTAA